MSAVSPDVERMLAAIRDAGGRPMLVGGFVRDLIMDRAAVSKDIDVEVYGLTFAALAEVLGRAGRVDEVGKSYGVLKIRAGDTDLDVNVPRRERKIGVGHRGFDITPDMSLDFREASARRDFTMNAILLDPEAGTVIDCHGGLDDIAAGVLRHTSAAFAEDPLRVLRAVQFAARFGFRLAPETAALCQSLAGSYGELPVERVWCEIEKIGTRGKNITAALTALEVSGWERHFPQLAALHGIEQDPEWHPEGDVHVHSGLAADQAARLADGAGLTGADRFVVVMAALAHDFGKVTHTQRTAGRITSHDHAAAGVEPARAFLSGTGCPEGLIARITPLVREHMNCTGRPTKPAVRRLARRLVPATMAEMAIVCGADRAGRGDPGAPNPAASWLAAAADLRVTERPAKGLLTGDHLIAAGMKPGPAFRPLLADALAAQDAGEFEDEAGALRWLAAREAAPSLPLLAPRHLHPERRLRGPLHPPLPLGDPPRDQRLIRPRLPQQPRRPFRGGPLLRLAARPQDDARRFSKQDRRVKARGDLPELGQGVGLGHPSCPRVAPGGTLSLGDGYPVRGWAAHALYIRAGCVRLSHPVALTYCGPGAAVRPSSSGRHPRYRVRARD